MSKIELDRDAVEAALRAVIEYIDYDLHKDLEGEDDPIGEGVEDTYPVLADRFIAAYNATQS
jgi:hypothetical protein